MFQGSDSMPEIINYVDPAFSSDDPIYSLQSQCKSNSTFVVRAQLSSINVTQGISFFNIM